MGKRKRDRLVLSDFFNWPSWANINAEECANSSLDNGVEMKVDSERNFHATAPLKIISWFFSFFLGCLGGGRVCELAAGGKNFGRAGGKDRKSVV